MVGAVLVFIFGVVIGSFLNVCIHRIPRNESIVWPSSHCPKCGKAISPVDNIPLLSFLILKGKCRACGEKISVRYFLVELLTAILGVGLFFVFPDLAAFGVYWLFACILLVIVFIDIEHRIVPDVLSLPGIILGFVLSVMSVPEGRIVFSLNNGVDSLLGMIAGAGCIFIMGTVGEMIFHKEAVGGGDLKLMGMIGAFLGWKMALLTFFMAPIIGSVCSINILIQKKDSVIPYAPYLCASAMISLLFGEKIIGFLFPVF
ncbi:MAG TPA: prepilin peptidase [Candidatus Omnitrophota bacterium]|nr:prepilin peptidase [Candidatus Omnitrophota bacterium]HPS19825.1 prepilin peptidase [Candidatus Omnitrophota bacterium]